jgi:hypothetical protein
MKMGCFNVPGCVIIFYCSAETKYAFHEIAAATVKHTTFEKTGILY